LRVPPVDDFFVAPDDFFAEADFVVDVDFGLDAGFLADADFAVDADFVVDADFFVDVDFEVEPLLFADFVPPLAPLFAELALDDFELPPDDRRDDLPLLSPIGSALPTAFTAPPAASPTLPAIFPAVRPTDRTTFPGSGIGCPPCVRLLTGRSSALRCRGRAHGAFRAGG
jgi:hypothetical protein